MNTLRQVLRARFDPFAADHGFVVDRKDEPRWTVFRRRVRDRVQIFMIQWDKYGAPRFVVVFGTCPSDGLDAAGRAIPADEVLPSWCQDYATLQPKRGAGTGSWFRQDSTRLQCLWGRPRLRDPHDVIEELLAAFGEIEQYWSTGEVGPHVRLWRLRRS